MKKLLLLIFVSALLQGCLGKKNAITEDAVFKQTAPVCNTEAMCKKMWTAAGEWADRYSPQGIETYTDQLIRSEEKEVGSDEMEIIIRKVEQKDGSYKIVINNVCSRTLGSCSEERSNMIAFNKKLIGFMSAKEKQVKEKALDGNIELKKWIKQYTAAINKFDADALSGLMHLPVTYVEADKIIVLTSVAEVSRYLQALKTKFAEAKGEYVKADSTDIFALNGKNLYVNLILNVYDADSTIVAAQQTGIHLVMHNGGLKMISSATHSK